MRLSFTCTNLMPVVSWILLWGTSRESHRALRVGRAAEARSGAPGIAWDEIKRDLLK